MPLWLWIVGPIAIIAVFAHGSRALAFCHSGVIEEKMFQSFSGHDRKRLFIYVPGILAHGVDSLLGVRSDDESRDTVLGTLRSNGNVLCLTYASKRFSSKLAVWNVQQAIKRASIYYDEVVVIGSSLGGVITEHALGVVDQKVKSKVVLWLMDTPDRPKNMLSGGNIGAPLLRLFPILQGLILGSLKLPWFMKIPPKDDAIEDHLDKEAVKRVARKRLGTFLLRPYAEELAYMAGRKPKSAHLSGLKRVIYFRCDRSNETVKQPNAEIAWGIVVEKAEAPYEVLTVDGPHVGYLQQPHAWEHAIGQALLD